MRLDIEDYKEWTRKQPCIVCLNGPSEFSHLDHGSEKKVPSVEDWSGVPMCAGCHRLKKKNLHNSIFKEFEELNRINLWKAHGAHIAKYLFTLTEVPPNLEHIQGMEVIYD